MGSNRLPGSGEWGLSSVRVMKLALVGLCGSVVLFVHAYQTGYPLGLTHEQGYISQVPLSFWAATTLAIVSLLLLATSVRSIYAVPVLLWLFYLVFHSRQLLYYNLLMSDNGSISEWNWILGQFHTLPAPDSPEYFAYLQWPLHHLLTMVIQRTAATGIMDTIGVGFVAYLSVFAVGVFYFMYAYSTRRVPFYLFAGGSLYLVISSYTLNNQFVPQFLGLTILVFLIPCHRKSGTRWAGLRICLFFALVVAHPFIYIFYIAAFLLSPLVSAAKRTLSNETEPTDSVFGALGRFGRNPGRLCLVWLRNVARGYRSSRWISWSVTLVAVYVTFLVYRFVSFQLTVFYKISQSEPGVSQTPFSVIVELLPGPLRELVPIAETGGTDSSSATMLLYDLVPQGIHPITRNATIAIIVSVFGLLLLSQLLQRVDRVQPLPVSLFSAGSLYFVVGGMLPLLAKRALQVVFLPMVTALDVLDRRPIASRVVIALLLVSSPVILANGLVNQSIAAGGNTEGFHTTRAGLQLSQTAQQQVVVAHQNSRPLTARDGVVSIQQVMEGEYSPSEDDLVVSSPFVDQYVRYYAYDCPIEPEYNDVVYDNRASGLWLSGPESSIECVRT